MVDPGKREEGGVTAMIRKSQRPGTKVFLSSLVGGAKICLRLAAKTFFERRSREDFAQKKTGTILFRKVFLFMQS